MNVQRPPQSPCHVALPADMTAGAMAVALHSLASQLERHPKTARVEIRIEDRSLQVDVEEG